MKIERIGISIIALFISCICGLGIISLPKKEINVSAADAVTYNQYMLEGGVPSKKALTTSAGSLFINGEKVLLLKPLSYMNLSGEVVKKYVDYFGISLDDILVISDDLALDVAVIRLRLFGSCGGHNGLKNIELHLSNQNYKRIKIGISNDKNIDTKDYVLGKFSKAELELINPIVENIPNVIIDYLNLPFDNVMNKYNK